MLIAVFLCSTEPVFILKEQYPERNEQAGLPLDEKLEIINGKNEVKSIFPFGSFLSDEIDEDAFCRSFLIQPDLFLRIRPGRKTIVEEQLHKAGISFQYEADDCIRLSNQSKVDEVLRPDVDAVVQDLNSQKTLLTITNTLIEDEISKPKVWDCCAASGGKSILFHDRFPGAQITASDVRESIMLNLRNRFNRAGIHQFKSFVTDIASADFVNPEKYDVVICDAPCTGSGTWSRTPEQSYFFHTDRISYYSDLQKKITSNAASSIEPGGYFIYITCSVFKQENEDVAEYLKQSAGLELLSSEYLKGYDKKADTLYTALFKRN